MKKNAFVYPPSRKDPGMPVGLHLTVGWISLLLAISGCASHLNAKPSSLTRTAHMWMNQTADMRVEEAYAGHGLLYVKFQVVLKDSEYSKFFFARAQWHHQKDPKIDLSKNLDVPLEIIDEQAWRTRPERLQPVVSLSKDHWRQYRTALAHHLAPEDKQTANLIRSDEQELVFFYDASDNLRVLDIKEKPKDIRIGKIFNQQQLAEDIVSTLQDYMKTRRLEAGKILLTVDNEDDYTTPFVYVDLDHRVAINLKLPVGNRKKYRANMFTKGWKSADYLLLDGHFFGVAKRPVSSVYRLFSWTKETTMEVLKPLSLIGLENKPAAPFYEGPGMDLKAFEERLDKLTGKNTSTGSIKPLIGGDQFFPRMIEVITAAKETIDIRIFIFDNDDFAVEIADLLKRKSKEGVKVRVLLDGLGQVMGEGKIPDSLPDGFVPPPSMEQYLRRDSAIEVRVRPSSWFKADHTKTVTIDSKIAFTGGMNIGREYRYDWHDLMIEINGPFIGEINREFEIAWIHAGIFGDVGFLRKFLSKKTPEDNRQGYDLRPLFTRLNDPQIFRAQLAAIRFSKNYIYAHNPYFSDDTIIFELIKARRRGVDVRVILPVNGNHGIMNASNVVTANTMFHNGIRVFLYPGMSHVKAAIFDGWLCAGSANLDKLSLRDNLEFNVATSNPRMVKEFKSQLFEKDFIKSKEMTEPFDATWKDRLAEILAEQL